MADDFYERYKEALRLGHVAVLRGALEEAIEAYRNAASIAPSRALPHTSIGGVLLRLGHIEEALVEYEAAVARAPHDEGALLGLAEALTGASRPVGAARALDHVSEIQEDAGRLPEAADTLRRALELEDAPERSRRQRGLIREIRLSTGDQAAEQLLARALRLRDEPPGAVEPVRSGDAQAPLQDAPTAPAAVRAPVAPPAVPGPRAVRQPVSSEVTKPAQTVRTDAGSRRLLPAVDAATLEPLPPRAAVPAEPGWPSADPAGRLQPAEGVEAEPPVPAPVEEPEPVPMPAVGAMEGAVDTAVVPGMARESEHQPTGDELLAAAEAADLAGDTTALRSLLLWTARAYAREGLFEAGLDATHRLLQRAPGDVDAHLVLVELYVAREWNGLAVEKLALLHRLAVLNRDEETRQRLCAVAGRVFPEDKRLQALCS